MAPHQPVFKIFKSEGNQINWTEDAVLTLMDQTIRLSAADATEVVFYAKKYGSTRFAANEIHQNMAEENSTISIRVAKGKRIGACATNQLDMDSIKQALKRAEEAASLSQEQVLFQTFAEKQPLIPLAKPVFDEQTGLAGADVRAQAVMEHIQVLEPHGYEAAGSFQNGTYISAVATDRGQRVFQKETRCRAVTVVNRKGQAGFGTGYSECSSRSLQDIHPGELAREAKEISELNHNSIALEPGAYTVILSPVAVGELLHYLSWMAINARAMQSGQSFLFGKKGQKVLSECISLEDNALNPDLFSIQFDWEGNPKCQVTLIKNGVAEDMVYDTITAAKDGVKSTGHALSPFRDRYYSSPLPTHLVLATGQYSLDELIASTATGIFINRFWYVREVNFKHATVTGMSRDGTFIVKNGKFERSLFNLRFTQSLAEAFANVIAVGNQQKLVHQFNDSYLTPALKIENFNIVGSSTF